MSRKFYQLGLLNLIVCLMISGLLVGNVKAQDEEPLRIGVAAMISPKDTINVYQQILDYVGKKLGRPVKMVQRKNYDEMDELIKTKEVDVAFICSGPYVSNHDEFGAELLVAPQAYGKPIYYCYIIGHKDSPYENMKDLRDKTFAFTDPKSNTGYLVPNYMLAMMDEDKESFFSKYIYSGHHDKSIKLVAEKKVEGAAVDHLIWEYMNATDPTYTAKTKIITKSPPFGIPPIVVHPSMDPALKARLREIFLDMDKDPQGQEIIRKIFVDKFVVPEDKDYDTVRDMSRWLEKKK